MEEIWKKMKQDPSYEISNNGRMRKWVKSKKKWKYMIGTKDGHGYLKKRFGKRDSQVTYRVHRLVAEHFIPKVKGKDIINHKNGIKTDNRVENLEWCTVKENVTHAITNNLTDTTINRSLDSESVKLIKAKLEIGVTNSRLAKDFGVSKTLISRIKNGKTYREIEGGDLAIS